MSTFVLVHGGGHGGWCWQPCAHALRARGHDVYTPTLTGFGERGHLPAPDFETFVTDVVNVVEFEELHDVVLVGHSMGGVITPRVAEAIPDRVATVVWLTACVSNDGESLLDTIPQSPWIARAVTIGDDGTAHTDVDRIIDANIHDGTDAQKAFVRARHRPYPPHALVEPGRLSAFLALGIPTAYVFATLDRTIEPQVQEQLAARLPGCRTASVAGGHDCMLTQPDATADALIAVSMTTRDLPLAVSQYVDGMNAHDWQAVRASFADRFERIGPFPEHHFTDPDVYTQFLADLLPTLQHHTVEVVRADTVGAVSYVTICERLRRGDTDVESYLVLACDLSPDGRLARIEAFLRRTA